MSRFRDHIRANVVGYIALFFALSAGAYAAVGVNTVGSKQIRDNKVKSIDIQDGGIGAADVDSGEIQLRASGDCDAGEAIRSIAADGSVSCETDDAGGPPSGPASGDLAGDYPNPTIAPDAIGTSELTTGAVTTPDLADGAVSAPKLANGAVTASKLGTLTIRSATVTLDATGQVEGNGAYDTAAVQQTCNFGERAISVGGSWGLPTTGTRTDEELVTTNVGFVYEITTNEPRGGHARVGNDTSALHTFTLQVVCLD